MRTVDMVTYKTELNGGEGVGNLKNFNKRKQDIILWTVGGTVLLK